MSGTISVVVAALGVLVGIGGAGSFIWANVHIRGMGLTIELVRAGNAELRSELTHERDERHRERIECAKEIAHMEGRMQVLTDGLGEQIATAAVRALLDPERRQNLSGVGIVAPGAGEPYSGS